VTNQALAGLMVEEQPVELAGNQAVAKEAPCRRWAAWALLLRWSGGDAAFTVLISCAALGGTLMLLISSGTFSLMLHATTGELFLRLHH
jgi:hypothetical protein